MSRRAYIRSLLLALAGAIGLLATAAVAPALAASPHWYVLTRSAPTRIAAGAEGLVVDEVANLGDAPFEASEASQLEITDTLPKDLEAAGPMTVYLEPGVNDEAGEGPQLEEFNCQPLPALICESGTVDRAKVTARHQLLVVPPFISFEVRIPVKAKSEPWVQEAEAAGEQNVVELQGGDAPAIREGGKTSSNDIFKGEERFGLESFTLTAESESGAVDAQAGSHPYQLTTAIALNEGLGVRTPENDGLNLPEAPELVRNVRATLPPGLVANATNAFPRCSAYQFGTILAGSGNNNLCPEDTAIGAAIVTFRDQLAVGYRTASVPLFNLEPAPGEPARLGFEYEGVPVTLDTALKTGEGYAVEVSSRETSEVAEILSAVVTVWGVPEAASHNDARGWECLGAGFRARKPCEDLDVASPPPYLTLPTQCTSLESSLAVESWHGDGERRTLPSSAPMTLEGCASLPFDPSFELAPFTHDASTPTGLKSVVSMSQASTLESSEGEEGKAEEDLRETSVELPPGFLSNAGLAYANLLTACPAGAVGFEEGGTSLTTTLEAQSFQREPELPGACETAKIGDVTIVSPLLERPLTGSVYLGAQDTNPFTSPLVLYLVANEAKEGIHVKLAGEVRIAADGQLTTVFKGTPPVPFERLELTLANEENGERAANSTPPFCGPATTNATFTSYSEEAGEGGSIVPANVASRESTFDITSGPGGSPCPGATLPFGPSFEAGPTNNQAGAMTPFTLRIGHADGQQALGSIDMTLPPGEAALIKDVEQCSEAQAEANACPPGSEVGETTSVSGLGGKPVTLHGRLYLTGPLAANGRHGASPFGIDAVTEAKAGPFNLGLVKVLSTITINETTAAATVDSEPIPDFIKGVPAQLKEVIVTVERPGNAPFEFNPTNCEQLSLTGSLTGWEGASAGISDRFYVTNCASLPFEPKIKAKVAGQGSKAEGTSFTVTLESPGLGQANVHKVDLTIPASLPSRLTTIQKACLEAVFDANPASCDEGSVIGEGIVYTPVFKNPLMGPAYLVSHGGAAFPDVEFVLQGEGVKLVVDGKTYIHDGITYSKFETTPDAPFTKFESIFPAGPHSALTPNVPEKEDFNLCKTKVSLPTELTGQNGALISETTPVEVTGCKGVAAFKETKAELLAKALKKCKTKFKAKRKKKKRAACEKAARKKYGPKHKKKSKKK